MRSPQIPVGMFRLNTFTQCVSFKHIYDVGILVEQLTAVTFDKSFERVLVVISLRQLFHTSDKRFYLFFFFKGKIKKMQFGNDNAHKLPNGTSACLSVTSDWQYSANTGHMSEFIFSLEGYQSLRTAHLTAMLFCFLLALVLITRVTNFPFEYSVPIRLAGTGVARSLPKLFAFPGEVVKRK